MEKEIKLMKGNEVIAEAAIRCGADGYFGYPITPQSEVMETLMEKEPWKTTGMVVVQAESELSSINMVYGGAACGKRVMTSSSSPGISLMCEGLSYIAAAELPCVVVNVTRGGPGLGTIQPSQGDYNQATKGGGHGDYRMFVLAPASVQEMHDFVFDAFEMAFKYRTPVMILSDGVIGQMMEKVVLADQQLRWTNELIIERCGDWALTGKTKDRQHHIVTSLDLDPYEMEKINIKLFEKYARMEREDVRYEEYMIDDADYLIVAFGSSARISKKTIELAREAGYKVGLLRPITLFPFPSRRLIELSAKMKGMLVAELNMGQMVDDVRLAVNGRIPVEYTGRSGGAVFTPEEIFEALKTKIIK